MYNIVYGWHKLEHYRGFPLIDQHWWNKSDELQCVHLGAQYSLRHPCLHLVPLVGGYHPGMNTGLC